jgi:hypothetical protein
MYMNDMNNDIMQSHYIIRRIKVGTRYEHIENGRPAKHTQMLNAIANKNRRQSVANRPTEIHKEIRKK